MNNKHIRVRTIIELDGWQKFDIKINDSLKQLEDNGFGIDDIKYNILDSPDAFYYSAMIVYYKID